MRSSCTSVKNHKPIPPVSNLYLSQEGYAELANVTDKAHSAQVT